MASDDQMFDSSPGGNALEIIGALLGGASGRPLGGGLMALGNMFNKRAAGALEKARRPKTLALFKQHGLITDNDMSYYADLPTQAWQEIEPGFWRDLQSKQQQKQFDYWFQKSPQGEVTGEKVLPRGSQQPGPNWYTSSGLKSPKVASVKEVAGAEADAAQLVGAPLDRSKWTPQQIKAISALTTKIMLSRQKPTPPQMVPETLIYGAEGGSPVVAGVTHPRTGGAPSIAGVTPLPFTPVGHGAKAAEGKLSKDFKIAGENYELTSPKGDPNNGIIRRTDVEPFIGRNRPKFLWRVNGKIIDPKTADDATILQARAALKAKGFTDDEIKPPSN